MKEPIATEDVTHLIPFTVGCGIREARDRRAASVRIECAPKRTDTSDVRNVGQNLIPATFGFSLSRQNGWCSQSRQRGGGHPSARRRSGSQASASSDTATRRTL